MRSIDDSIDKFEFLEYYWINYNSIYHMTSLVELMHSNYKFNSIDIASLTLNRKLGEWRRDSVPNSLNSRQLHHRVMRRVIGRPLTERMLLTVAWLAETMLNGSPGKFKQLTV